ncbi:MAG TPA: class I SAM-dependent methyltransferase [Balneolaceae bacterium]
MTHSQNDTAKSYDKIAEKYEQQWAAYLKHTHHALFTELITESDDVILDVSCGTGLLAKYLVEYNFPFKKLILNDISPKMQQKAKQRLGDHPDVIFTQQDASKLRLDGFEINKILCLSAFHNYENQLKALQRFFDLLQPEGRLYLLDWNSTGWFRPVNWLIKRWVPEIINTQSLQETELLLEQAGFKTTRKMAWRFRYWKLFFVEAEKKR